MKKTNLAKPISGGCSENVNLTRSKNTVQLPLRFAPENDPPVSLCLPIWQSACPALQPRRYASVKRVSLVFEGSLRGRPCLTSTQEAMAFFKEYWNDNPANDQEKFVVACLDTKHRVQCVVVVTVGTLDASLVHPREVFKPAFIEGSSAVVLSHNHPSGNTTPSREDHEVTNRLTEAGKLLGITVLDHIIYGDGTEEVLSIRECN
ncbi:JAB domain-containing protein [Rhodopirellula sp. P2]|uniref:JAB domain-containing protein n=1 Tax=Rhodopirellula sp. P2 TaxID=2127060 RepID=UPI003FD0D264